ncbi:MAG: helix-turn-helix transcriptional regulator [Nocardiopsaceae bacterium]|nr:helix-turn-helix transcriptional regulator [Nocardiopsaceae bacterium]
MREEHRRRSDEGWGPRSGRSGRSGRSDWMGRGRGDPRLPGPPGPPGPFPPPGPPFPPDPAFGLREALHGFGHHGFGHHGYGSRSRPRPRVRRGDVRAAVLDLLAEGQPWNGYQIIQAVAERTHGVWRPSAGSVYPVLQQLEDEGLIRPRGEGRRRMYTLTDEGRAYAAEHADELRSSWDAAAGMTDDAALELGDMIRQVTMAVMEVHRAGSAAQVARARRVLAETRRSVYRILADDEDLDDEDLDDMADEGDEPDDDGYEPEDHYGPEDGERGGEPEGAA